MPCQDLLGPRVRIIHQAVSQQMDRRLASLELTGIQSMILRFVSQQDGAVYARDVEKRFQLTHPTVSGLLQRMEAKGFVTLQPEESDRRLRRIGLTPKAEHCQKLIRAHIAYMEERMLQGLSGQEQAELKRMLDRVLENLTAMKEETEECGL